jgi:hypothetical protein
MKLLALGGISPYGSTLAEHCLAKKNKVAPRVVAETLVVRGEKVSAPVERAYDVKQALPVPDSVLRRMSLSSQLSLSCTEQCRAAFPFDTKKVGIVVGNTYGPAVLGLEYVKRLVKSNYRNASPNLFAQSVHNNLASTIALTYGLRAPTVTYVQEENLWQSLMMTAELWLKEKSADLVWLVLGNEFNAHILYGQLYEGNLNAGKRHIATESFSAFLIGNDEKHPSATNFDLESSLRLRDNLAAEKDMPLKKPEHLGISLAEYYFEKYF